MRALTWRSVVVALSLTASLVASLAIEPLAGLAAADTVYVQHFSSPVDGLPSGWTGSGAIVADRGYGAPGALRIAEYWTEYNPSGAGRAHLDAIDNAQALVAQALVAQAAAMVGYHTGDRRMLEYARGLLWYALREFAADGRWYYDGAENPMNQRKAVSHDMAVLLPLLRTVPYLLKAGVPIDAELTRLTAAYEQYRQTYTHAPFNRIRNGQAVKLAPRYVDGTWQVTSFLTANAAGEQLVYADTLPSFSPALPAPASLEVRVSRLVPPARDTDGWTVDPSADVRRTVTPAQLQAGVATGLRLRPGDAFRITYALAGPSSAAWTASKVATFGYRSGTSQLAVPTIVPNAAFPTAVTADNYFATAAGLAFPVR